MHIISIPHFLLLLAIKQYLFPLGDILVLGLFAISTKITKRINAVLALVVCVFQGLPILVLRSPTLCTDNQIVLQIQYEIYKNENIQINFDNKCELSDGLYGCLGGLTLWVVVFLTCCVSVASDTSDLVKAKKMKEEEEEGDDDFDSLKEPLAPVPEYLSNISPDIAAHYGLAFTEPFEVPNSPSSNEKKESNCCGKFSRFCIAFFKFDIIILGVAAFAFSVASNVDCHFVYFSLNNDDDTTIWAPYTYMGFGLWKHSWYSVRDDGSIDFDLNNCQPYDAASVDSALIMARVFSILSLVFGAVFIVILLLIFIKKIRSIKAFIFIMIVGVSLCVSQVLPLHFVMNSPALCTDNQIVAQAESEINAAKNITSNVDLLGDKCSLDGIFSVLAMILWVPALVLMCFVTLADFMMAKKKEGGNDRSST